MTHSKIKVGEVYRAVASPNHVYANGTHVRVIHKGNQYHIVEDIAGLKQTMMNHELEEL